MSWISGTAAAENRGLYVGVVFPLGNLGASFDKTVDNRAPDTLVPEPRRGTVLQDATGDDVFSYGAGAMVGFRMPLGDSGVYLGIEAETNFRGGAAGGEFSGIGMSTGRNQLGEFWPDRWTLEGNLSYGTTLRLSSSPAALTSMNASLYVLGGVRWLEGRFTNMYFGCLSPVPCSATADTPDFVSGTEERDTDLTGWTIGVGAEQAVSSQLALRLEARYTRYGRKRWVTLFDDVGVTVPATLNAEEMGVALGLVWYP